MAGKDGKLESKGGDVVRQGFMIKRSQNKKRFTPVNYKQRWFVLTKHYLIYYDGDGEVSSSPGVRGDMHLFSSVPPDSKALVPTGLSFAKNVTGRVPPAIANFRRLT